jgi:hypothetical protein
MMAHIESLSQLLSQAHQKMKLQVVFKCKRRRKRAGQLPGPKANS